MNYIIPKQSKLVVESVFEIENTPINMDNIITFEKCDFSGIKVEDDTYPSVDHKGVGNKAVGSTGNMIGVGFPAIMFCTIKEDTNIYWVYSSVNERDSEFNMVMDYITKKK